MKKGLIITLSIIVLFLPIIVITGLYFISEINTFIQSEFWYGYMAYFGTVSLAAVSLWQNENANLINKRLADMTCKEKIAYIVPTKVQIIRGNVFEFRFKKRGNSFGFFENYALYIDNVMVSYKSFDDFYEETNTDQTYEKNIDLSEYQLSDNPEIFMVIRWRNQFGFKYFENIMFDFNRDEKRSNCLISDTNLFEINYAEDI